MKAILLSGASMLDQWEIRQSLIRIPEVLSKIRYAQKIVDSLSQTPIELINCMLDDDVSFVAHAPVRRVLVNAVQLGLYERYVKSNSQPKYFIGTTTNLSTIEHILGMNFIDELFRSVWFQNLEEESIHFETESKYQNILKVAQLGRKVSPYFIYEFKKVDENQIAASQKIDESETIEKTVQKLIGKYEVKQIVNLGASDLLLKPYDNPFHLEDIQVFNTVEIDPMLTAIFGRNAS